MAAEVSSKFLKEKPKEPLTDSKHLPNYDKFPDKPETDCNLNELQEGSRVIDECHVTDAGSGDTEGNIASQTSTTLKDVTTVICGGGSPTGARWQISTVAEQNSGATWMKTSPEHPAVHDDACNKCGVVAPDLKICSRCKKTRYCCRDCQRSDWRKHKKTCKAGEGDVDNLIQQLRISGDLHTMTIKPSSKITFQEAKVKVIEIFPGLKVIDKMSDLDYRPSKGVFVAKVTVIHINIMKYGVGVKDTDGKLLALMFRIPDNKTLPYFDKDVTSGSYACVKGARLHPVQLHLFAPDNVCVLVTDASTVRFLA